jgi:hypothetical protein
MAAAHEHLQVRTGYALGAAPRHAHASPRSRTRALLATAMRRVRQVFGRGLPAEDAVPAVPGSLVYGLCMQYDAQTLWENYFNFRMNPCARTWRRLQRQPVPWLGNRRLREIVAPFLTHAPTHTPDSGLVKRTLMNFAEATADSNVDTTRIRAYRRPRR